VISHLARIASLAALYFLFGKLGLSLAVTPGYATMIWPPSGLALGALLLYGRGIAPGVFLGSFLLNATVGHAAQDLPAMREILVSACIATGSTAQALLGRTLIVRWFGEPIRLRQVSDVLHLLVVAVPLACLVSPTVGVLSLMLVGGLHSDQVTNWFTWWTGDMFGVLVFLPLALVVSGRTAVMWRERAVRGLQALSLMLLVLPLGLTFIAWRSLAESTYRQSQSHFESLARESEQAIHARLATYASAARSGGGIFQSSVFVSSDEWGTFVDALRLRDDYPGMLGLGWIERGSVEYLEPEPVNGVETGMDVAAHPLIREALARAADSGEAALTPSLTLGSDDEFAAGFLLLQPVYRAGMPVSSAEQRRHALRGFVFTPFQARGFFADLTPSQGRRLDLSLFEGSVDGRALFSTRVGQSTARFSLQRSVRAFGTQWTLQWQSTLEFERAESGGGAHLVLFGGLLFSGLFAVLLLLFGARRPAVEATGPLARPMLLPVATFALVACGSFAAFALLSNAEKSHISSQVEGETRRLEAELDRSVRARLQLVRRMAHRWSSGGGTPYVVWRNDARDLVRQIAGLEQLQWIGPDYHMHWSEGNRRHGWVDAFHPRGPVGISPGLAKSAEQGITFVTEPREIAAGESAFMVYVPVSREGRFDGFIASTIASREFFGDLINASVGSAFTVAVRFGPQTQFADELPAAAQAEWKREGGFKVNDRQWTFSVSPTREFVDEQQTLLPVIVLVAGLLIAFLSGFLVRYVLVSRLKAARMLASAEALAISEQRYELALRGMSVGLFDWDIRTNDVFLSQRCRGILGITDADFAPKYSGFTSRLHPDDRPRLEKMLSGHLKQQNPFDIEFRIRRNDGEYVWVHSYGQAQFDAEGFASRMAGSMQDITLQKQQAQELERSAAQQRLLVENAPAAVAMFDSEMRYLMTSRRWIQDYNLDGRDITGMSHYDVFPEIRAIPRWMDIHQRALRGERFDIHEDSWTRADGQQEHIQWAIHPWLDSAGNVGGIIMFTEVITARKQAEAALRTSEAMNRAAMDKSPIGKALVQPDGRFVKVNPALCQLLGYSEQEMLDGDFQGITHPEDLAADLAYLRNLLDGKIPSYQMEKRYFHRDGRVIWARLSVSMVRKADGSPDFLVAQIQDITERKNIDRMKDEFASVVASELRAPLAEIRDSLCEIAAAHDGALSDSLRGVVESCRANCDRVGALVDEIVDLDRLTAGQMRFDFRDESVAEITQQAVAVNEAYDRISLLPIDPALMVYVDTGRYGRVLSNLLHNAAKFSPPSSRIEVGAEVRGEWVRIYVRDQGEGIPDEFRPRIFGRFALADSIKARQKGGAGLGLYLARQMVEQMRGTIGFVSQAGSGTTFWVEFPRLSRGAHRLTA
jgi:PAS domain S-box-containing protein